MNALLPLAAAGAGHGSDAVPTVLLLLAFVVVSAKPAGELFERLGQPAVLGELLVGIALGNGCEKEVALPFIRPRQSGVW